MPTILFEVHEPGVALLTINRPQARNALTWEAMQAFARAIEAAHLQPDLRALVITGAGGAFCAGGDLFELDGFPTRADGARLSSIMGQALERLEALPFPTIAAMEGPAFGGGAEVALACDLRVMAHDARLGLMHVRLAICPAWGGGQRLLRMVGYARALEWLAAGRVLSAEACADFGLANRVVPSGEALAQALHLAGEFAARAPAALRAVKRLLRAGLTLPADQALAAERAEFPDLWAGDEHLRASARFVAARKNHKPL